MDKTNNMKMDRKVKMKRRIKKLLSNRAEKVNRTKSGNAVMFFFVGIFAAFSVLPLILAIGFSLKPLNELFVYPPTLWPRNPTLENFTMLFNLMTTTWVPFSRYIFNTVFITVMSIIGHVIFASMAAYPLAKHRFPGQKFINEVITMSLMFVPTVNDVANYLTMSALGWIDNYLAIIVPAIGSTLGLFLMRNYMSASIPDSLLESARIDGAGEFTIFWKIVMPIVKPAWLTLIILMFQSVWNGQHSTYIYSEEMKTLPYALSQIVSGGIIRRGAGQAVSIIMMLVPCTVFIINQSKILETMASSGMKE